MTKVANIGPKEVHFTPAADLPKQAQHVAPKDTLAGKNTSDNCLVGFVKSIYNAVTGFFAWLFGYAKVENKPISSKETQACITRHFDSVKKYLNSEKHQAISFFITFGADGNKTVLERAISTSNSLNQTVEKFSNEKFSGKEDFRVISYIVPQQPIQDSVWALSYLANGPKKETGISVISTSGGAVLKLESNDPEYLLDVIEKHHLGKIDLSTELPQK